MIFNQNFFFKFLKTLALRTLSSKHLPARFQDRSMVFFCRYSLKSKWHPSSKYCLFLHFVQFYSEIPIFRLRIAVNSFAFILSPLGINHRAAAPLPGKEVAILYLLTFIEIRLTMTGLEVNFLVHLLNFASKIFFHWQMISLCFGDMDYSNWQTFASGYFSHSQIIKIIRVLRVCER